MSIIDINNSHNDAPIDFYDLAEKFAEETSTSDQPHRLLKIWARRFPEYAADLASIAYARLAQSDPTEGVVAAIDQEAVIQSARRVFERLQSGSAPLKSLLSSSNAVGLSAKSLADVLRIDQVLLAKLEQRLLKVSTIPVALLDSLAAAIKQPKADVLAYLSAPPRLATGASYKSKRPPSLIGFDQQTFAEALSSSRMISAENRSYWLEELSKREQIQ